MHIVRSPDNDDKEYFDINAGVIQGDNLAPLLCIITLDYVLSITYYLLTKIKSYA